MQFSVFKQMQIDFYVPKNQNRTNKVFQVENELVEYKEKRPDSLEKEAVAFLNAKDGDIYIGVNTMAKL
jgi:predicted HTH transcriptional regulator